MQNIKKLDDRMTVSGQITTADIPAIKAAGFSAVMCNRPDGEQFGQPAWREIAKSAQEAGLETWYAPMAGRNPTVEELAGFAQAVEDLDGPIFAYCRSGARCEILWTATQGMARAAE
jgi:sulfide:quinone oxidoreductase